MIRVEGLSVRAGSFRLKDLSFTVDEGASFAVLGPSGAGKTLLLESLLGLRRVESGRVLVSGVDVTGLPPERRGFSYVPQDLALFPHLSVRENVLFGLRAARTDGAADSTEARLGVVAGLLRVEHLLARPDIAGLSGGEKQRVALARALIVRPRVLFLDEPFSSLDASLGRALRDSVLDLQDRMGFTVLHVTHDQREAFYMAHRIALLFDGRIAQIGAPVEIRERPASVEAAEFLVARNVLSGMVEGGAGEAGAVTIRVGEIALRCPPRGGLRAGDRVRVVIRPESARIVRPGLPLSAKARDNVLDVTVTRHVLQPDSVILFCAVPGLGSPLEVHVSPCVFEDLSIRANRALKVAVPVGSIWVLREDRLP